MTLKYETNIKIRTNFWKNIKENNNKYVHIIMIATKPDIIKQAPLYLELKKRGEFVILIHTGQHYDYNLSKGALNEFSMKVDINLNVYGELYKKYSLIIKRLGDILSLLLQKYKKIPIPYVHGDTLTATTADKASFLNKIAVVHIEAGIRTFTPKKNFYHNLFENYNKGNFNWNKYYNNLKKINIYETGSIEPFPEQFDTRGIEPSTGFYAIPVKLYKKTLISEGYLKENMKIVGNTISDTIKISKKKIKDSKAFEIYPNMRGKNFIFITIHRRENTEEKERFLAIYYAIKKLIIKGFYVCFLSLYGSENAINNYGLRKDIENLKIKYKNNFSYGPVLAHHHEVIDMISVAGVVVTDSGSMQEESNIIGVPCVTIRFGSDRIETILNGNNIIAPPVNSRLIFDIIKGALNNKKMIGKNLYGNNVSKKIVDEILRKIKKNKNLFRFDHERLELKKFFNYKL